MAIFKYNSLQEFLDQAKDIDVYDNYTEEVGCAYIGSVKLTAAGKEKYKDILGLPVTMQINGYDDYAVVSCEDKDTPDDIIQHRVDLLGNMLYSMAGYCSETEYDELFCDEYSE